MHCDHTVYIIADLSLRLESIILGTLTPRHVHLLPAVFFPVPLGREVGYGCAN